MASKMEKKIRKYISSWQQQGYPEDIPDEVPIRLMQLNLAPSYQAICNAILKNDHSLKSLGFTPAISKYYMALKKIEIEARPEYKKLTNKQLNLI